MNAGRSLRRLVCATLVCATTLPNVAGAAPVDPKSKKAMEEASTHFRRGVKLFEENDAAAALAEFKRAYDIAPNWSVLYSIAGCYYQLGDYAHALTTYERYLKDGGADVPAKKKAEVQKELDELRTRVGKLTVRTSKGAEVLVDDESLGTAPMAAPALLSAGRRKVTVRPVDGPPINKMIDVVGGDELTVEIGMKPAKSVGAADKERDKDADRAKPASEGRLIWPWWAATGATAAATAVFGVLAIKSSKDVTNLRAAPDPDAGALSSAHDRTKNFGLVADICGVVTLGLGAYAIYVTVAPGPKIDLKKGAASVQVGVGPGTVTLVGSF